jgi:glycosyltransferase involved in cell wall biosynthesis
MNDSPNVGVADPGRTRADWTSVLVWAVYPPGAGWRGEGISQTVENILLHSPEDTHYTLVVSAEHAPLVDEVLGCKSNVRIVPLGFTFSRLKTYDDVEKLVIQVGDGASFRERVERRFERVTKGLRWLVWRLTVRGSMVLAAAHIRSANVVFNPSPTYALNGFRRKPKIYGFWDPFVFEYSMFGPQRRPLLRNFMFRFLVRARSVVTQSSANRDYLVHVLHMDDNKIAVINNGAPSYTEIFAKFRAALPVGATFDRRSMLEFWPRRRRVAYDKMGAMELLIADTLNHSVLFRLAGSLRDNSKIIVVSTQYRPYKGFEMLFALIDRLIAVAPDLDFRFVFTAELPKDVHGRLLGRYAWLVDRVFEMTRLTNLQHACLYHLADLTLHPSLVEGGPTLYPASEAASVGCPSLTNAGRHTREMIERDGEAISTVVADFARFEATIPRIVELLTESATAAKNVTLIEAARVDWKVSSRAYSDLFRAVARGQRAD